MQKIEAPGTYIGTIVESGFKLSTNGIPQWVARFKAEKRYIEAKADIEWFQQNKGLLADGNPGWVDWAEYDEDIVAFLTLYSFKTKREVSPDTETLNAKQLNAATGWTAPDFEGLANLNGQQILFRVEFRSYTSPEGKTIEGNQVTWIDNKDANPTRSLNLLDPSEIKNKLAGLVTGYGKQVAKPASAARPASTTPARPAPAPSAATSTTPSTPAATATPPSTASGVAAPTPAAAAPTTAAKTPPKRAKKAAAQGELPAETDQNAAWAAVNAGKGQADDEEVAKVWMEACNATLGDRDEQTATGADWAKIRDTALANLHFAALVPA